MAKVLRIKRELNCEPLDAVVVNCKRRKIDDGDVPIENVSTVLKFAGTANTQDDDIFQHIKKPKADYKTHTVDIKTKLRNENQSTSKLNRFKVVNSFRSVSLNAENSSAHDEEEAATYDKDADCIIYDLEADREHEEQDAMDADHTYARKENFVYDLYYTNSDDVGDADFNELVSVYPLSDGLIYGLQYDEKYRDSDSDHSEDSNAESNWRNEYPNESDCENSEKGESSVTEEDMMNAVNKMSLYGESDLSSDNYEDCGYGAEEEASYGTSYARFKAKVKDSSHDQESDSDDYDESCTP